MCLQPRIKKDMPADGKKMLRHQNLLLPFRLGLLPDEKEDLIAVVLVIPKNTPWHGHAARVLFCAGRLSPVYFQEAV